MLKKNNQTIGAIYKGSTTIEKIYKGNVLVWEGWKKLISQGIPPLTLTKCKENKLLNYQVYGNSIQNGTPTPDSPIEIQSVGDLITDSQDEHYGKYKIPVNVNNTITNIYLEEPLRKIGDYADYIDFENGKVVRRVAKSVFNGTEDWADRTSSGSFTNCNWFQSYSNNKFIDAEGFSNMSSEINTGLSDSEHLRYIVNTIYFGVIIKKSTASDLTAFRQLLSTSNLEIYQKLEKPAEESVTLPDILLNKGTNIIDIETSITPSNLLVKYKGK